MLRELWDGFLNLVFPPLCILCRKYLPPADRLFQLCPGCLASLEHKHPPFCRKCSRPLKSFDHVLCRTCENALPLFDHAASPLVYNETCQRLIHLFKYSGKTGLRHYFAAVISDFLNAYSLEETAVDLISPVPLHPTRYRERGYNQAQLLSEPLARALKVPLVPDLLRRSLPTATQAALSQKERWTNISGAFRINHPALVRGKKILLVDDVLTTGATASEAARVLKDSGACAVYTFTLAIARLEKELE